MTRVLSLGLLALVCIFGCDSGSEASTATGAQGSSSGDASGGDSGDSSGGDSNQCTDDADCPMGTCELLGGGPLRVCAFPRAEATVCSGPDPYSGEEDECCTSADCEGGVCLGPNAGAGCSGALAPQINVCAVDLCTGPQDCLADQICVPAGVLGFAVSACAAFECLQDTDCDEEAGGRCVLEPSTTCCNDVLPRCRYPEAPPLSDECPP